MIFESERDDRALYHDVHMLPPLLALSPLLVSLPKAVVSFVNVKYGLSKGY